MGITVTTIMAAIIATTTPSARTGVRTPDTVRYSNVNMPKNGATGWNHVNESSADATTRRASTAARPSKDPTPIGSITGPNAHGHGTNTGGIGDDTVQARSTGIVPPNVAVDEEQ